VLECQRSACLRFTAVVACLAASYVVAAEPVHEAAKRGDVEEVKRLIAAGTSVGALGSSAQEDVVATPLHFASLMGRDAVVELLLASGADVDAVDRDYGIVPVHVAAMNGHAETVELLVDRGADLNRAAKDGATPLHFAGEGRNVGVIKWLAARGADLTLGNWAGVTPLHLAAQSGCDPCVEALLAGGADVDARGALGQTPLQYAAYEGHESTIELLLSRAADLNAKQDNGATALSLAEDAGRDGAAALLRRHGADRVPQVPRAAQQEALATLLLDSLATLRVTTLHYDTQAVPENVVRLIETPGLTSDVMKAYAGGGADDLTRFNLTLVANRRLDTSRGEVPLVDWGAFFVRCHDDDFAWVRAEAANALGKAEFSGVVPKLVERLEQDEDPEVAIEAAGALSAHVQQPIFIVVGESGRADVWAKMEERGFEIEGPINSMGWRPLGFAVAEGRRQTARMLLDYGAQVDAANSLGRTALMFASVYGFLDLATWLLDAGADPNVVPTDDTGWPALIAAAQRGHSDVVALLLAHGADPGVRDLEGKTALDRARTERHRDVVRLLEAAVVAR
jgi:ankyrin repeat protein